MRATLGETIRHIRRRKGLTQQLLAERAGIKLKTLRQAELDRATSRGETILKIAVALGLTADELELTAAEVVSVSPHPSALVSVQNDFRSTHLDESVPRLERILLDVPSATLGLPEFRSADPPTAMQLRRKVNRAYALRQASRYSDLGNALLPTIAAAQRFASEAQAEDHQQAHQLLAEAYHVAASFLKKTSRQELAWLAIDRATAAAEHSEHPVLKSVSTYRLANLLQETGQLDAAADLTLHAIDRLEPLLGMPGATHAAIWGALHLKRSVIASRRGDAATVWECIGEARAAARRLGRDRNDFWTAFGPTNVRIHEVSACVELGEWGEALKRAENVDLSRLPPALRERRAHFLVDLAQCLAYERQYDEALHALLQAEQFAPEDLHCNPAAPKTVNMLFSRERKAFLPGLRDLAGRLRIER